MNIKAFATALAFACALATQAAQAQPAPIQTLPSYAQPNSQQTIKGRIQSIVDPFHITVADSKGYVDTVQLHQGTIINPTGLTLAAGMSVTILGYSAGDHFDANEIDTPYTYSGPVPGPVYYGPGWWYPGYVYGYGPAFGLTIGGGGVVRGPFAHSGAVVSPPYPHRYVGRPYVGRQP
ncbi:MAG: hypothetical protein ABSE64_10650 [Vulcanimicrobiaceae bacterium]|jgi:hypothetical protein